MDVRYIQDEEKVKGLYNLEVYVAKFHRDKALEKEVQISGWMIPIQVGAALTEKRVAEILDSSGKNISYKNANYCELTALYWIWKNRLSDGKMSDCKTGEKLSEKYYGLFHYRRFLDLQEKDLERLVLGDIDAVLPYPTVHEPDISEHHARYIKESDWDAVLQTLKELEPEYYSVYNRIFSQRYLYNYNILVAKAEVLKNYCGWLFPILERVEELTLPRGSGRADRYIGYIGENLLTLYFMHHYKKLKIVHTGRLMLT